MQRLFSLFAGTQLHAELTPGPGHIEVLIEVQYQGRRKRQGIGPAQAAD